MLLYIMLHSKYKYDLIMADVIIVFEVFPHVTPAITRRPASADGTARRQFQATGQPVSRTQSSDAVTSRLPCYEVKCVERRCFQWGSVPLHSDIKGTELPPVNILIPGTTRKAIDCATTLPLTIFI